MMSSSENGKRVSFSAQEDRGEAWGLCRDGEETNSQSQPEDGRTQDKESSVAQVPDSGDSFRHSQHGLLPEDSFSFFVFAKVKSWTFGIAVVALFIQVFIVASLTVDIFDKNAEDFEPENRIGIPAQNAWQVSATQLVALMIAGFTQTDVVWALNILRNGFDEENVKNSIGGDEKGKYFQPENLKCRWYASLGLRIVVGFYTLLVTFFLVARSATGKFLLKKIQVVSPATSTKRMRTSQALPFSFLVLCFEVRDTLLDFTAIEFVSQIDNFTYQLASWGYFGKKALRDTRNPIYNETEFEVSENDKIEARAHSFLRRKNLPTRADGKLRKGSALVLGLFPRLMTISLLFCLWFVIVWRQINGKYLPDTMLVQLGDESQPDLAIYSGVYKRVFHKAKRWSGIVFRQQGGGAQFEWCKKENYWAFITDASLSCTDAWALRSDEQDDFVQLAEVAGDPWIISDENNVKLFVEQFHISSAHGMTADCGSDTYGWACEKTDICPKLVIDQRGGNFLDTREWSDRFELFQGVKVYARPVYYAATASGYDLILFLGYQWVLLSTEHWPGSPADENSLMKLLQTFDVDSFASSSLGVSFVSEGVEIGTEEDSGTPANLRWFYADTTRQSSIIPEAQRSRVLDTSLLCSVCDHKLNQCLYNGTCNDGNCTCATGSFGERCESAPLGNGLCNGEFFNVAGFGYDGGDCCLTTCRDSDEFYCGRDETGKIDAGNALCKSERDEFVAGATIAVGSEKMSSVDLGCGGTVLALADHTGDRLVVMDRKGSKWIQRGQPLKAEDPLSVKITEIFPGTRSSVDTNVPVKIAVQSQGDEFVFLCNEHYCFYHTQNLRLFFEKNVIPSGYTHNHGRFEAFDITRDGSLAVHGEFAEGSDDVFSGYYLRFLSDKGADQWQTEQRQYLGPNDAPMFASMVRPDTSSDVVFALGTKKIFNRTHSSWEDFGQPLQTWVYRARFAKTGDFKMSAGRELVDTSDMHRIRGEWYGTTPSRQSVVLSEDGQVLLVGSFYVDREVYPEGLPLYGDFASSAEEGRFARALVAKTKVYAWQGSEWKVRHEFELGKYSDNVGLHGWSQGLSRDGSVITIATEDKVTVYRWNGDSYSEVSGSHHGSSVGVATSLSDDGSTLVTGLLTQAKTFINDRPVCSENERALRISYIFAQGLKSWKWELRTSNGDVLMQDGWPRGDDYVPTSTFDSFDYPRGHTFVHEKCVSAVECGALLVAGENGLHGLGVFFNGEQIPLENHSGGLSDNACLLNFSFS